MFEIMIWNISKTRNDKVIGGLNGNRGLEVLVHFNVKNYKMGFSFIKGSDQRMGVKERHTTCLGLD